MNRVIARNTRSQFEIELLDWKIFLVNFFIVVFGKFEEFSENFKGDTERGCQ